MASDYCSLYIMPQSGRKFLGILVAQPIMGIPGRRIRAEGALVDLSAPLSRDNREAPKK